VGAARGYKERPAPACASSARLKTDAESVETNISADPAFAAILEDVEGEHRKTWDEFGGAVKVRYTAGQPRSAAPRRTGAAARANTRSSACSPLTGS